MDSKRSSILSLLRIRVDIVVPPGIYLCDRRSHHPDLLKDWLLSRMQADMKFLEISQIFRCEQFFKRDDRVIHNVTLFPAELTSIETWRDPRMVFQREAF
jgi:hypothetical protein